MLKIKIKKIILLFASLAFVFLLGQGFYSQLGCGNFKSFFYNAITFAYAAPYSTTSQGICQVKYESFNLAGSFVQVPVQGGKAQSQGFPGYQIYEYFYPANPDLNTDKRRLLYSFNDNGSVGAYGNLVMKGAKTQFYNDHESGTIGIGSYQKFADGVLINGKHIIDMTPRSSNVAMKGNAIINDSWNEDDESGLGPSVFFNPNSSELVFKTEESELDLAGEFSLSDAKKDVIIETSLVGTEEEYYWREFLRNGDEEMELQNATALAYAEPYFYVADRGNRRIVRYDAGAEEFLALGKIDWNWILNGIAVDNEDMIFVTDSAVNTVIKTKITGEGWEESYRDIDDFQSRLFLDGSEVFRVRGANGMLADDVNIKDCGYTSHEVLATSSNGHMELDPASGEPRMKETNDCAFGNSCFYFNGYEHLDLPDSAAWNFEQDNFTIDFWVKFASLDHDMALVSHPNSFLIEYNVSSSTLIFAFMNNEFSETTGALSFNTYQHIWEPEINEWYHVSIVRSDDEELIMYIDGQELGARTPINGTLRNGTGILQLGSYFDGKHLHGWLDNIRIARGSTQWSVDFSYRYQFSDPRGIIVVGDYLYIADFGHDRIVKMSKDFREWSTFGSTGSGRYEFDGPSDIYFFAGNFYIVDSGNGRVVRTDMANMIDYLKGNESGSSWEVIYSSDSPGLHSVLADEENILISDWYNGQIIKNGEVIGSKNPWDLLFGFTSPVDIQPGQEGHYYILDGVSNFDFSAKVGVRALDVYGTGQKEDINARFNTGGLITPVIRAQGVVAKLNYDDWYRWIGDNRGPAVAHCPEEPNLAGHLDDARCDYWLGLGQDVDCGDSENAPPSECVNQWDWEIRWPVCARYIPSYIIVNSCLSGVYCNDTNPGSPLDGSDPNDYICDCDRYGTACISYCQVEELDCHEGFAVAYKFLEAGPPGYGNSGGSSGGGGDSENGGGNSGNGSDSNSGNFHHYNPDTVFGPDISAIILCPGDNVSGCSLNGRSMTYHGMDRGRQVWRINGNFSGQITITCDGNSWTMDGATYTNGSCS